MLDPSSAGIVADVMQHAGELLATIEDAIVVAFRPEGRNEVDGGGGGGGQRGGDGGGNGGGGGGGRTASHGTRGRLGGGRGGDGGGNGGEGGSWGLSGGRFVRLCLGAGSGALGGRGTGAGNAVGATIVGIEVAKVFHGGAVFEATDEGAEVMLQGLSNLQDYMDVIRHDYQAEDCESLCMFR